MKKLRRGLLVLVVVLALGFVGLWLLGPTPVSFGPYVQNVTSTSAEICWFDETPGRIEVTCEIGGSGKQLRETVETSSHRVRLAGLAPATRYEYGVRDLGSDAQLGHGSFVTPPADGSKPFTFAVVGDSGKVPRWFRMRRFGWERMRGLFPDPPQFDVGRWMAAKKPDFFVHLGDVIYSHDQFPAYQEAFYRPFEAVLRHASLIATLGNHDMHTWERPEFFRLFHPPQPLDPKKNYSDFSHTFVWGSVRFLVLDTFWQKWEKGSESRKWLESTLRDNEQPRTIVISHSPAFTDERGTDDNAGILKNIWPTLARHKVDLVLSGDTHSYQRFEPVDGVTQVIVGTGGKSIRTVEATARLAHVEEEFGFLLVEVRGTRLQGSFWAGGDAALDRFVIGK